MFSFLAGVSTSDILKGTANSTKEAFGFAAKSMQTGMEVVTMGASKAADSAAKLMTKDDKESIKKRNEARRLGVEVKDLPKITPQQRWEAEQLNKFKLDVSNYCSELSKDMDKLKHSCFAGLYRSKIHVKHTKWYRLNELLHTDNWSEFTSKAQAFLDEGGDVTVGRHSRTKAILDSIVAAKDEEMVFVYQLKN